MTHFTPEFAGQGTVCAAFVVVGLLLGHYLPWRMIVGPRGLDRVQAYVWGSLWLAVPNTIAALVCSWSGPQVLVSYWLSLIVGGLVVMAAYAIDDHLNIRAQARENAEISRLPKTTTGGAK